MHKLYSITILVLILMTKANAQQEPDFLKNYNQQWVDSVFTTLTLDQKIGQLLMPRGNYSGKPHDEAQLTKWIQEYKIGGIVFFATNPTRQAALTNRLQALSNVPLFIGQDFEWGLGMRLDSTDRFPYAMALGAIKGGQNHIVEIGAEMGRQCKRIGVHINYAPVVDVNVNPLNPVINFRSFGADKFDVALKSDLMMRGMQSQNIICTAKHFPGHGDTQVDSHMDLPIIPHDVKRLEDIELYPFKVLINNGLSGVMTAHLSIPAWEPSANMASTFSKKIITDILKTNLNFKGLTFTDAMEMEGAVKSFPKGEAFVQALLAGNDIIETFIDVPLAVAEIKKAVLSGRISMDMLNAKVIKILKAKSWVGLDNYAPIDMKNLVADLNTQEADIINYHLTKKAITCLRNEKNTLPIQDLDQQFAVISLEGDRDNEFVRKIQNYVSADVHYIPLLMSGREVDSIINLTKGYDHVIVGIHFNDIRPSRKYGLSDNNIQHIRKIITLPNAIVAVMASPFIMQNIEEFANCQTLMMAYQKNAYTESAMAQAIFGAEDVNGKLPLTINDAFQTNASVRLKSLGRLRYGPTELVGIDRDVLAKNIEDIVYEGLNAKAYPGCVVQVSKNGVVIHQKAYGSLSYVAYNDKSDGKTWTQIDDAMDNFDPAATPTTNPVKSNSPLYKTSIQTSYDLASVTKIAASTLAIMQLTSDGKFDIQKHLSDYFPDMVKSNKSKLKFADMLTHRSGLQAWIPFWRHAVDTSATMQVAIAKGIFSKDSLEYISKKANFIKRLFGVKPKIILNYDKSISKHTKMWDSVIKNKECLVWKPGTFADKQSNVYTIPLAYNMYAHKDWPIKLRQYIVDSPLGDTAAHKYVYSDLHFYLYPEMIQQKTGQTFESYLYKTYRSLGAHSLMYNPPFDKNKIAPTEIDSMFRNTLIHGKVHDEGAALMGGVSGHAGLFGNANDLHTLMYMYLRKGSYAGKTYFNPKVIDAFSKYQFDPNVNRRGIGFDKKDGNLDIVNGPSLASAESYGHSGFTGTYTWVDPKSNLVYVFLSNRVYPTRDNQGINTLKIRQRIGDAIYQSYNTHPVVDDVVSEVD
jgi:beta-N-acetylhexosaminidase